MRRALWATGVCEKNQDEAMICAGVSLEDHLNTNMLV